MQQIRTKINFLRQKTDLSNVNTSSASTYSLTVVSLSVSHTFAAASDVEPATSTYLASISQLRTSILYITTIKYYGGFEPTPRTELNDGHDAMAGVIDLTVTTCVPMETDILVCLFVALFLRWGMR